MRHQMINLDQYKTIWVCDTEFIARPGEHPEPVCLVAIEYRTGETIRIWADEMATMKTPPFPTGEDSLFVVYYGTAELGVFKANGWGKASFGGQKKVAAVGAVDPVGLEESQNFCDCFVAHGKPAGGMGDAEAIDREVESKGGVEPGAEGHEP